MGLAIDQSDRCRVLVLALTRYAARQVVALPRPLCYGVYPRIWPHSYCHRQRPADVAGGIHLGPGHRGRARNAAILAAISIGLAASLKPQIAAPVIILYLVQRRWKPVAVVAAVTSGLLGIASLRLYWAGVSWAGSLLHNVSLASSPGGVYDPAPTNPLAFQLVNASPAHPQARGQFGRSRAFARRHRYAGLLLSLETRTELRGSIGRPNRILRGLRPGPRPDRSSLLRCGRFGLCLRLGPGRIIKLARGPRVGLYRLVPRHGLPFTGAFHRFRLRWCAVCDSTAGLGRSGLTATKLAPAHPSFGTDLGACLNSRAKTVNRFRRRYWLH